MSLLQQIQARFFAYAFAVEPFALEDQDWDVEAYVYKTTCMKFSSFKELKWLMLYFTMTPKKCATLCLRDNPMELRKKDSGLVAEAIK